MATPQLIDHPSADQPKRLPGWWGKPLTLAAEAAVMVALAGIYLSVRREGANAGLVALPDLRTPALGLTLMLASVLPMWYAATIAKHAASVRAIGSWLAACVILGFLCAGLRVAEIAGMRGLYGWGGIASLSLVMLTVHLAHLAAATASTLALTAQMLKGSGDYQPFGDVRANARYWYLMVGSWVLLYPIVYLSPRFI